MTTSNSHVWVGLKPRAPVGLSTLFLPNFICLEFITYLGCLLISFLPVLFFLWKKSVKVFTSQNLNQLSNVWGIFPLSLTDINFRKIKFLEVPRHKDVTHTQLDFFLNHYIPLFIYRTICWMLNTWHVSYQRIADLTALWVRSSGYTPSTESPCEGIRESIWPVAVIHIYLHSCSSPCSSRRLWPRNQRRK